jgi:hypothetical protein
MEKSLGGSNRGSRQPWYLCTEKAAYEQVVKKDKGRVDAASILKTASPGRDCHSTAMY